MPRLLTTFVNLATTALLFAATVGLAEPGGAIQTLTRGSYQCGRAGDASGERWKVDLQTGFVVINGSSYRTPDGRGTYLLSGRVVQFTSGPLARQALKMERQGRLRFVEDNGLYCYRDNSRR